LRPSPWGSSPTSLDILSLKNGTPPCILARGGSAHLADGHFWHRTSQDAVPTTQARDGKLVGYEIVAKHVTPELAYVVEIEHAEAKMGGSEDIAPFDLRVTMIFRPEDGEWKVVHRHADPITAPQPAESVIQE
jgi:hypothetical protein